MMRWDADELRWEIETAQGELTADVVVSATGPLSEPKLPEVPGLAEFPGKVFHSARWDHDYDLGGKRVAMIGTGASAIQIVPAIAPDVERLTLFQRTPPWVMPRTDRAISAVERWLHRQLPFTRAARRGCCGASGSSRSVPSPSGRTSSDSSRRSPRPTWPGRSRTRSCAPS